MSTPRLALLNAAHDPTDTIRNFRRELDADIAEFNAVDGNIPQHFEFDGILITGSRSSVYWDEDWILPLVEYIKETHERGIPILGVCFGHQALAVALGGEVSDLGEYEIGYHEITQTTESPLLAGVPETFTAFTTHSDAVTELPPDAELLAENDHSIQAFHVGQSYGVQFHPEYDTETAERVTKRKDDLDEDRERDVLAGITPENYDRACETKRLFENFTSEIVGGGTVEGTTDSTSVFSQ